MNKLIFYTRSGRVSPSSNFRAIQYVDNIDNASFFPLSSEYLYKKHGNSTGGINKIFWYGLYYAEIQLRIFIYLLFNLCSMPQSIVIQRALSPKMVIAINRLLMKAVYSKCPNLIWDFDDDIFASGELTSFEKKLLVEYADLITVTNKRLLSLLPNEIHDKVKFLPTTDGCFNSYNSLELIEQRRISYQNEINLLWLATSPSMPNLDLVANYLDRAAKILRQRYNKKLILYIVCNKSYRTDFAYLTVKNVLWSKETSVEYTKKAHIGIMPLYDTEFNKKKGGFKLIQYMAAAMPTIGSAVGYNKEIIEDGIDGYLVDESIDENKWTEYIVSLGKDWTQYYQMSVLARKKWDKDFSFEKNLKFWERIVTKLEI